MDFFLGVQLHFTIDRLFCLNGIYYIRTLFHERGERRLRAPNVIDADILVSETDEFRCMGTILGRVNGILET